MTQLTRRSCLTLGVVLGTRPLVFAQPDPAANPAPSFCPCVDPIDRYVAWTGGWRGRPNDPALWSPLCEWVASLTAATRPPIPAPFQDAADLIRAAQNPPVVTSAAFAVAPLREGAHACRSTLAIAREISIPFPLRFASALVSRGKVTGDDLNDCVVIANGDIEVEGAERSIVVADGDLTLRGAVRQSVVIARGDIRLHSAWGSSVVAGGRVISIHPWARNREAAQRAPDHNHTYRGGVTNAFGLVRFTSAADLGVEVVSELGGPVRVAASVPGGLFPQRAFHPGDELLRVGDTPLASAREFRRLVRDAAAVGREVVVSARRDGQPFTARVAGRSTP